MSLHEMTDDILRTDRSKNFLWKALEMGFSLQCNIAEVLGTKTTEVTAVVKKKNCLTATF